MRLGSMGGVALGLLGSKDEAQELSKLLQCDFFCGIVGIYAVHNDDIQSGNHGNEVPPAPQAEKLPSGTSTFG